jgi:molybdate transport system permease protein
VSRVFPATLVLATSVAFLFLLLPVVAIFARVPPGDLVAALGSSQAKDALVVTVETNLIAMALIAVIGTPTAYLLATRTSRLRDVAVTLVELPLVLPPAVAGIGLLAAFGRLGLLGRHFELGSSIAFTKIAVVLAVAFVASPFYVRSAIAAFEDVHRVDVPTVAHDHAGHLIQDARPVDAAAHNRQRRRARGVRRRFSHRSIRKRAANYRRS